MRAGGSDPQVARSAATTDRAPGPLIDAVEAVGITVSDADRSAEFLSRVLDFEKIRDVEVTGPDYEHLEGVFGARVRVVRMRLGQELLDLLASVVLAPGSGPDLAALHSSTSAESASMKA